MILNILSLDTEHPEVFCKNMLWKISQNSQKNTWWVGVWFLITREACTFIKNEIATQVFYEIFENVFFIENLQATVSVSRWWKQMWKNLKMWSRKLLIMCWKSPMKSLGKSYGICSKLTIKMTECHSSFFIAKQISQIVLVSLLLTLIKYLLSYCWF